MELTVPIEGDDQGRKKATLVRTRLPLETDPARKVLQNNSDNQISIS